MQPTGLLSHKEAMHQLIHIHPWYIDPYQKSRHTCQLRLDWIVVRLAMACESTGCPSRCLCMYTAKHKHVENTDKTCRTHNRHASLKTPTIARSKTIIAMQEAPSLHSIACSMPHTISCAATVPATPSPFYQGAWLLLSYLSCPVLNTT